MAIKKIWSFVIVAVAWEVYSRIIKSPLLPSLTGIMKTFWRLIVSGEVLDDIAFSLTNIMIGFVVASFIGLLCASLMYNIKFMNFIISPFVDAVRPIAALTIFPLIILTMGIGYTSKIFVIFWTAWPGILLNSLDGFFRVDQSVVDAARVDGANPWVLFQKIVFPLSLPAIMTGLRIGMGGGWISLVSSEMLGSNKGLGYSTLIYSQTFRFNEMYAVIILIALIGLIMNVTLLKIQNKIEDGGSDDGLEKSSFVYYVQRAATWAARQK